MGGADPKETTREASSIRDSVSSGRIAQKSAMLVLMQIFKADLQPEECGYRAERNAKDAENTPVRFDERGYRNNLWERQAN